MYTQSSDLRALYESWPTSKLVDAVLNHSGEYTPEALALLRAMLVERGVTDAVPELPPETKIFRSTRIDKRKLFGLRFGAFVLDGALSYSILLLANFALGDRLYGQTLWLWFGLFAGYYVFSEGRYGATPAKKLTGLCVITKKEGRPCGYGRAIVRFVLRIVECFIAPIVTVIAYFSSEDGQRLGDMLAGTIVVRIEDTPTRDPSKALHSVK